MNFPDDIQSAKRDGAGHGLGTLGLAVALPLLVAEIDLSIPANAGFSAAVGRWLMPNWGCRGLLQH